MKYLISIFIALFLGACSQEQPQSAFLLEAEQMISQHPDSVLRMLKPYWNDSTMTETDHALFGLLYTEALHRTGLSTESDSLILASRRFYEQRGDKPRMARALLHHAIVLYHQQHPHEAVLTMKRAELISKNTYNPEFKCYLYTVLGDVNDNVGNYPQTIRYYKLALKTAKQSQNKEWRVRALNNIAQTFDALGETDSLKYYTEQAKPYTQGIDGEIYATYLTNKGSYLLRKNKRDEAKSLLLRAQQKAPSDRAANLLANIYLTEKDTVSAALQWYQLVNSFSPDVCINSYRQLIDYLTACGETNYAAEYSKRLNEVYQELYQRNDVASIIALQTQFDKQQKERHQYQTTIALLSAIILLVLITGTLFWYNRRRIDHLNAIYLESMKKYDLTRKELTKVRRQREHEIKENSEQLKPIVSRLHTTALKGKHATNEDWDELSQCMYTLSPNLQLLLSPLNAKEQHVCLLIRQNFLPTEIAILTMSSPQTITNMRVRLLKKLFTEIGGAKDFDTKLRTFE